MSFLLASCREDWEETGDPQALASALFWVFLHRQLLPVWLSEAAGAALIQRRGKEHVQQYEADARHRMRWWCVKRMHDNGAPWEEAYEQAADKLRETAVGGSAESDEEELRQVSAEAQSPPRLQSAKPRQLGPLARLYAWH